MSSKKDDLNVKSTFELMKGSLVHKLIHNNQWEDLQDLLKEDYNIENFADQVITTRLMKQFIDGFDNITSIDENEEIKENEDMMINIPKFNDAFDSILSQNIASIDENTDHLKYLFDDISNNKQNIQYYELLSYEKLPNILLQIYKLKGKHVEEVEKGLKNIFAEFKPDCVNGKDQVQVRVVKKLKNEKEKTEYAKAIRNNGNNTNNGNCEKQYKMESKRFDTLLQCGKIELTNNNSDAVQSVTLHVRSNAWLSCDIRIDAICNKEQCFTISGWINVIWCEPKYSDLYQMIMDCYTNEANSKNIWYFENKLNMRILDLREADKISYYLPIDARKIFEQTSVQQVEYMEPPHMIFDKYTRMIRTEYHIKATLSEHFELFSFPYDKQFLNIKLRWNTDFYHILHWITGKTDGVPNISQISKTFRDKQMYYNRPLKVGVVEELADDVLLHQPWIGLQNELEDRRKILRFALIRLRFTRNPTFFALDLLFPLFLIVLSGFSVYAVDVEDVADRLGISITVLLTFAAFQSLRAEQLPNTAELILLDYWILYAYIIQMVIIFGVCYPYFNENANQEHDSSFATVLFLLWTVPSLLWICGGMSVWLMYKCCGKPYQEDFCLCERLFWEKRGEREVDYWIEERKKREDDASFKMKFESKIDKKRTSDQHHCIEEAYSSNQDSYQRVQTEEET
eukprot:413365_1